MGMLRARACWVVMMGLAWSSVATHAQPVGGWSAWRATMNDPDVQWRWNVTRFNRDMSPVCEFEFNRPLDGIVSFSYLVRFDAAAGATGERKGREYEISKSKHGGDAISGCKVIQGISIANAKVKGARAEARLQAPDGVHYTVITSKPITKAALVECGRNDPGFPNVATYRSELREYTESKAGKVTRTYRKTVDVFVRCFEP